MSDNRPADVPPEPLRGKAATQDRILEAATQLFIDHGFEKTTVAQVAELAGVSRATVFWHFSEKRSLFREAFNRLVGPFRISVERDMSEIPPTKRLLEQIELFEDFVREQRRAVSGFVRFAVGEPDFRDWVITTLLDLQQRYTGAVTQTVEELVPEGVDPRPLATGLITLLDGNVLMSLFDDSPQRVADRKESVLAFAELIPRRDFEDH
jgi:AcrR family transcriptional regulator